MSINIKEHYETLEKAHEARIATLKNEAEELQKSAQAILKKQKELRTEKGKKEELMAATEAEGMDTTILRNRIKELESDIAAAAAKAQAVQQKSKEILSNLPTLDLTREFLLAGLLTELCDCEEALPVEMLTECWSLLPVGLTRSDDAGRPIECVIGFGQSDEASIPIKPTDHHFTIGFRPADLAWLPEMHEPANQTTPANNRLLTAGAQQGKSPTLYTHDRQDQCALSDMPAIYAFIDKAGRLVLSRTTFKWQTSHKKKVAGYYSQEEVEYVNHEDDFKDIATPLKSLFSEMLAQANGQLDLDADYTSNPLMQHLKTLVLAHTAATPVFEVATETLTSAQIYKAIKEHWDAFTSCPWSKDIKHDLALLKYNVENGERVRFWSLAFKNYYGFRLRTRDHSWITGQIFIAATGAPKEAPHKLTVHTSRAVCEDSYNNNHRVRTHSISRIGNMWIYTEPRTVPNDRI